MDTFHVIVVMAVTFGLVFGGVASVMSFAMQREKAQGRRLLAGASAGDRSRG
jgi:hypothetical protein